MFGEPELVDLLETMAVALDVAAETVATLRERGLFEEGLWFRCENGLLAVVGAEREAAA